MELKTFSVPVTMQISVQISQIISAIINKIHMKWLLQKWGSINKLEMYSEGPGLVSLPGYTDLGSFDLTVEGTSPYNLSLNETLISRSLNHCVNHIRENVIILALDGGGGGGGEQKSLWSRRGNMLYGDL